MISIFFDQKAIGFNNYQRSARNGRRYTTKEGKAFCAQMHNRLNNCREELDFILSKYDEKNHMFEISIYYYYTKFYTKRGTVSKTCMDCDAPNKIVIDQVFNYIGVNDALLASVSSKKLPGKRDCFIVHLSTCPIPQLGGSLSLSDHDTLCPWLEVPDLEVY